MKLLIFGTGLFYENRKVQLKEIYSDLEIIGFVDNNTYSSVKDGLDVYHPNNISELEFDFIILMSKSADDMKKQLISIGIEKKKIKTWDDVLDDRNGVEVRLYGANSFGAGHRNMLVISPFLGYSGVPIVSVYIAEVMEEQGINVTIVSTGGDYHFIQEMVKQGHNVVIYPKLNRGFDTEIYWLSQFDYIFVNSFVMLEAIEYISKYRHVFWWLHEASYYVKRTLSENPYSASKINLKNTSIFAVSNIAKENLNGVIETERIGLLPYGIPDKDIEESRFDEKRKIVFAIIGTIEERKAQDIFINAALTIDSGAAEFWIIGATTDNVLESEISQMANVYENIKILGELSRKKMEEAYEHIDVLVCPSREDPFPVTVTEALMYGKPVIVSEKVGQADYLQDGINGFICQSGSVESLSEKMKQVISNKGLLKYIGQSARKLYEEQFTLKHFAHNLQDIILQKK
ncbi:glycosyltransferase family 4 protein [Pseudobutyrivibrio sp. MD2005]|uniref:glycosyltransferase family 4 protein n=1 Tax=Pseudobutyrivibrio sp. MD2005 TaxID=1410616 RepID=UPI00048625FD|nr:glycosyltransferase family 4 protein [Pseudobutyrivibrio sp. MD2005]